MGKILLVGDSALDRFVYGRASRLCPDVPACVLEEDHITENGGLAYNVYNNIVALGGNVDIVTNQNWRQSVKTRIVDDPSNYIFVRWDKTVKSERVKNLDRIDYSKYELIVVSDYCKGFIAVEDIQYLCSRGVKTFLDTKKKITPDFECVDIIKINTAEYNASKDTITPPLQEKIIQTLGPMGCAYRGEIFPVEELEVRSVSGAGDSFLAALSVRYVETKDIRESIKFANRVSSKVITKKGVGVVHRREVE